MPDEALRSYHFRLQISDCRLPQWRCNEHWLECVCGLFNSNWYHIVRSASIGERRLARMAG